MSFSKVLLAVLMISFLPLRAVTRPASATSPVSAEVREPQTGNRAAAEEASSQGLALRSRRDFGSLRQAIAKYQEALAAWKSIGDRQEEANTLTALGELHNLLGEKQRAVDHLQQALQMSQSLQDRRGEAAALNGLGAVYWSLSDTGNALDYYNRALAIRRELGDLASEAQTLNNIALAWNWKGEYQKALENFSEALQLRRKLGDRTGEAQTLTNLGVLHKSLGENQKALECFSKVLSLWQQAGDRRGTAYAFTNLSEVHKAMGDYQKALDQYNEALSLIRAIGDRTSEASTLNNIGAVYGHLGDYESALNYLRQALEIRKEISDRLGQAYTLNNLGQISALNGDSSKARDFYNEALPLLRKTGDRFLEASVLLSLGQLHALQAKKEKALENFDLALAVWRELRYEQGEAETLTAASQVYLASSKLPIALDYAIRSLQVSRTARDRSAEAMALYTIARVQRELGNLNETRTYVEASIEIIESTRSALASLDLRASYRASNQAVYELYIDVLMHLNNREPGRGYDAMAFAASERARARSLLETLTDANLNIREGVDAVLLEQERNLRQRFSATDSRVRTAGSTRNETQRGQAERDLESLLTEYQTIRAQIRSQSPRYAAIMQPRPSTLEEIQRQVLDDETLLLQYALGKDRSHLWAVTKTGLKSYELPPRAEIESVARRLYSLASAADKREVQTQVTLTAAQLSQLVLAPVVQQLGNKRLLIVADGALQYVPFAMLPRPSAAANDTQALPPANARPLVLDHEVVSLPSSSVLAFLRQDRTQRPQPAKLVAILADPVLQTSDPRINQAALKRKTPGEISAQLPENRPGNDALMRSVKESGMQFGRLQYTRQEADAITALAGAGGSLMAVDFDASKATATSSALSQYGIIHFATHGLINSRRPELSGIVLSLVDEQGQAQDGFLRLHDIHNMKLNADMVVMSACQTALGKEVQGEGLIGLTRAFMYAGAARTVSSLWDVTDESTSELMKRFYEKMFKEGLKPSAALRAAQVSMLKEKRWESPHKWAAFILQGEWR